MSLIDSRKCGPECRDASLNLSSRDLKEFLFIVFLSELTKMDALKTVCLELEKAWGYNRSTKVNSLDALGTIVVIRADSLALRAEIDVLLDQFAGNAGLTVCEA